MIIDGIIYDEGDGDQTPFEIVSHQSTDCALINNCSWFDWTYRSGGPAFRVQVEQVPPPFTSIPPSKQNKWILLFEIERKKHYLFIFSQGLNKDEQGMASKHF